MKKISAGPLLATIVVVIIGAMFTYFYLQLNSLEKKVTTVNTSVAQNSSQINAIVNFFNANLNGQNK